MAQFAPHIFSSRTILPIFFRRCYGSHRMSPIERRIGYACKKGQLNDAMEHLRIMVSDNPIPIQKSLGAVFHVCQESSNSSGASVLDELLSYSERIDIPDPSLASAQISCLSSYGRVNDAWSSFQLCLDKNVTLREKTLIMLLNALLDHPKSIDKIKAVISQIKNKDCAIPPDVGAQILSQSATTTTNIDDWRDISWQLLQVYRDRIQPVEEELVPQLMDWFKREESECQITSIKPSANGIASAFSCSSCGHTLEYGLSKKERTLLFNYSREVLESETKFFEQHKIEDYEIQRFMDFVKHSGPYGAIIDGMNAMYYQRQQKNVGRIIQVSRDMLKMTNKPVLVVIRGHVMHKMKPPMEYKTSTGSKLSKKDIVKLYGSQGIDMFYISNRVADDKYFIHAALAYPNTLLVTNDLLTDYSVPSSLKKTFRKWQLSHQTTIRRSYDFGRIQYEIPPFKVVQWTPKTVHVPIDNDKWICVTRNNIK